MTVNMRWHNPTRRVYEEVPPPISEAQAIEMLCGHPNSGEFIEEYRRKRMSSDLVEALILTGEFFFWEHQRGNLPSRRIGTATLRATLQVGLSKSLFGK